MTGQIGALAGQVLGTLLSGAMAKKDAKKMAKLQAKLKSLSEAQQKELEARLNNALGMLEKQRVFLEYLGAEKEAEEIAIIKKQRYQKMMVLGLIVAGVGITFYSIKK